MDDMLRYAWGEYRAWAVTSRILRKRITRWSLLVLVLTLIGTALGTLSPFAEAFFFDDQVARNVMSWVAAVSLGSATYFTSQLLGDSERQTWVKARALAEALKSESYKYLTAAPPYDVGNARKLLGDKVAELQGIMSGSGVLAEPISPEKRAENLPAGPWTIPDYIQNRVREQIDRYYRPAIARHRQAVSRARILALAFGVATVVLSASGGTTGGTLFASLLGIVTTVAVSVASWFQGGHHQQLAQNYQAAAATVDLLLAQRGAAADKQLVVEAEAVFQAEHAVWLAEWQAPRPTKTGEVTSDAEPAPPSSASASD